MGQRIIAALIVLVFVSGGLARAHEDLDLQIKAVTREIEREPKNALLFLRRGELHRFHQDWPAAKADYKRAADLAPDLAAVDLALGKMWVGAGDGKLAREPLDRFLTRHPDHAEATLYRARALVLTGERRAAVAHFTKAISLFDEPRPEHYLERAETLAAEGRDEEAVRGLDEGIRKMGPLITLQIRAIELEVAGGRYEGAVARVDRVLSSSERKDTWLARRGEIQLQAGRPKEGREAFAAALAAMETLHPRQRNARATKDLEKRVRAAMEAIDGKR